MAARPPLSIVIITLNEESNILRCIRSAAWAPELIVVDSGSTDRTCEIAQKEGATLRAMIDTPAPVGATSDDLVTRLNATTRELAQLRVNYDRLQAALQDAPSPVVNRRLMTQALSVFAVTLLLFMVGLESTVAQMMQVGLSSFLVATLGVIGPFVLGWQIPYAIFLARNTIDRKGLKDTLWPEIREQLEDLFYEVLLKSDLV